MPISVTPNFTARTTCSPSAAAYKKLPQLDGGITANSEIKLARLAQLYGDNAGAQKHLAAALTFALNLPAPPRETVAWLRWQLGETAFVVGDYESAEKHYRDSLVTFPDYFRAVASLGKVRAAQNDLTGAIQQYEKAVRLLPDPEFVAALGDLYKLAGREDDKQKQYELVEQIGRLSESGGALYNRQLALFYADHDLKPEEISPRENTKFGATFTARTRWLGRHSKPEKLRKHRQR